MKVLYVAPAPGATGGIADYAERFRLALNAAGIERSDVGLPVTAPTRADARASRTAAANAPTDVDLAHVELGANSHRELLWASALSARRRLPLVLTLHEPRAVVARPLRHLGGRVMPLLLEPLGLRRKRTLLDRAAAVLTLGPAARDQVVARWGLDERSHAIPHVSYSGPRADPKSPGPIRILYAGFFGPGKGLDVLLAAFERLLRAAAPVSAPVLVVAGAEFLPTARDPIGKLLDAHPRARAHIERTGFLAPPEFERLFASCHVGVVPYLPSVPGGSSGILLRGLGAGLAMICSDSPSLAQDVDHERTGIVVPAGDHRALAEALIRLASDPALRARLGEAAAREIARRHSPAHVGRRVAAIYASVLEGPAGTGGAVVA